MRFLFAVIDREGNLAPDDEMERIGKFNEQLTNDGHFVMAVGIAGPSTAVVIDNRNGAGKVSHGPVNVTDEHMSGFWILEADSLEQAMNLAHGASLNCNRRIEVRQLHG